MANTRARPTDLSQGSKTLTLQDRDPQAGKRSQYKLAQSLGPTSAGLTQIHLLPGDWRQRGSSPPPPAPILGPASSSRHRPPPGSPSPGSSLCPLLWVWFLTAGLELLCPSHQELVISTLTPSSRVLLGQLSSQLLEHGSQGETQVSWRHCPCGGGRWGRTADLRGAQPGGQNSEGRGTKAGLLSTS